MEIDKNLANVMAFVKKNDKLIGELKDAGGAVKGTVEKLVKRFEKNRKEVKALVESLGRTKFIVGKDTDTRERQAVLLDEIARCTKDIEFFRDDPLLKAHYLNMRAASYVALSRTYDDMAAKIIDFTQDEVEELQVLLARAALDTENRMKLAFIVDASIQLTKVALRVATKIVAI